MITTQHDTEITVPDITVHEGSEAEPKGTFDPQRYWRVLNSFMYVAPVIEHRRRIYPVVVASHLRPASADPAGSRIGILTMHLRVAYQHDSEEPERFVPELDIYLQHYSGQTAGTTFITVAYHDVVLDLHENLRPQPGFEAHEPGYLVPLMLIFKLTSELKSLMLTEMMRRASD